MEVKAMIRSHGGRRKGICRRRFVLSVDVLLHGEPNGRRSVRRDVFGQITYVMRDSCQKIDRCMWCASIVPFLSFIHAVLG